MKPLQFLLTASIVDFLPIFVLASLLLTTALNAQDVELRRQAVQIVERATAVSSSPNLPNLERVDAFRLFDTSSPVREGSFTRVVVQGAGRREETTFGDYHRLDIWTGSGVSTVRSSELRPPEVALVMRLTPIYLIRFDHEDVIRAIVEKAGSDRHAIRCIEFDTIAGQRNDNNEFCVDPVNGAMVSARVGDELVENSDFFPFAGALMPGKISYSLNGVRKLEITQTMSDIKDAPENVLAAPPNAQTRVYCRTYRRPIGNSMPQPKPGNGGQNTDVLVRGIVGADGKIHGAVVQNSDRPDLNAEALTLVQQWTFTPAMCNGNPNTEEATFILHFQGR